MDKLCPNCKKSYDSEDKVPMILACTHRMCSDCIQDQYSVQKLRKYSCATCKKSLTDNPVRLKEDVQLLERMIQEEQKNTKQQVLNQVALSSDLAKRIWLQKIRISNEVIKQLNQSVFQVGDEKLKDLRKSVQEVKNLIQTQENINVVQEESKNLEQILHQGEYLLKSLETYQIPAKLFKKLSNVEIPQMEEEQKVEFPVRSQPQLLSTKSNYEIHQVYDSTHTNYI